MHADTSFFGSEDATPASCVCVCVPARLGWSARACLLGAFWCASPFLWRLCPSSLLGPLRAGVALVFFFYFFWLVPLLPPPFPAFRARVPLALRSACCFARPPSMPPPPAFLTRPLGFLAGVAPFLFVCLRPYVLCIVFFFVVLCFCVVFCLPPSEPPSCLFCCSFNLILLCCPRGFCFCFSSCAFPRALVLVPLLLPPPPALSFFPLGGVLLPRARLPCGVVCRAVPFGGIGSLVCGAPCGVNGAAPPEGPLALVLCGVFCPCCPVRCFSALARCVLLLVVCVPPCSAVLVCLCRALWFFLSGLVACRPVLLLACALFWSLFAVLFGAVLCFVAAHCVWCCAVPDCSCVLLPDALLGCILSCCGVALRCHGFLCNMRPSSVLCRANQLWSLPLHVLVCLAVLCCVVPFVASFLLFVALSPVLAVVPCGAACGVFCWFSLCCVWWRVSCGAWARCARRACVVLSCAVLGCRLVAGWCLMWRPVFVWGSAGGPGCLVLSSSDVFGRSCPCSAALSLGALVWFPVGSFTPVLCPVGLCFCVVLCCGALLSDLPCWWRYFSLSCGGACWCCVLLPVVFGCALLGLAVPCLLVVPGGVFLRCLPCLAAWLAALWCVLWCSAVVLWCAVALCCLFVLLPVPVLSFLLQNHCLAHRNVFPFLFFLEKSNYTKPTQPRAVNPCIHSATYMLPAVGDVVVAADADGGHIVGLVVIIGVLQVC